MNRFSLSWIGACILVLALLGPGHAAAEVDKVRIGVQPGLTHLPWAVIEHERLIEQRAKAAGLGEVNVEWFHFAGGAALNDGMLSGKLDFAETGPPSLIILWAKSQGAFKGLGASGASPMVLVTRNPQVHSIADLTDKDRIAVPAVKTSTQAIVLAIVLEVATTGLLAGFLVGVLRGERGARSRSARHLTGYR